MNNWQKGYLAGVFMGVLGTLSVLVFYWIGIELEADL